MTVRVLASTLFAAQRMRRENVFGNGPASDEVFLNDALDDRWRHRVIPRAIRVYDGNWSRFADAQAVRLSSIDTVLTLRQAEFHQPFLEVLPRSQAVFARGALGSGLIGAEKNVPAHMRDFELARNLDQPLRRPHRTSLSSPSRRVTRSRSRYSTS